MSPIPLYGDKGEPRAKIQECNCWEEGVKSWRRETTESLTTKGSQGTANKGD